MFIDRMSKLTGKWMNKLKKKTLNYMSFTQSCICDKTYFFKVRES